MARSSGSLISRQQSLANRYVESGSRGGWRSGWVASAGAHIFLAPPREDRFCLPNTRFMLHQPRGGVYGQAMDIGIEAQEIIKMRKRLNQIIARQTGQPLEKVEKDTDRNYWMGAEAAVEYGIVGRVITREAEI